MAVSKKTGNTKSPVKMDSQKVFGLTVKWSHLLKPDLEYNSGHSVTVEINKELAKLQKELIAQTGVKKINGLKDDDGVKLASFRNKIHSSEGVERFPRIYDKDGQITADCPFGGDEINVVIKPKVWEMNGKQSISCYLEQVQWVKKNSGDSVTFEVIKDDGVSFANDNLEDDKLPF
tara:strand:+ start:449 stop:976 length:528 start_codon:yes stop_codon:yes gene_type:complete